MIRLGSYLDSPGEEKTKAEEKYSGLRIYCLNLVDGWWVVRWGAHAPYMDHLDQDECHPIKGEKHRYQLCHQSYGHVTVPSFKEKLHFRSVWETIKGFGRRSHIHASVRRPVIQGLKHLWGYTSLTSAGTLINLSPLLMLCRAFT